MLFLIPLAVAILSVLAVYWYARSGGFEPAVRGANARTGHEFAFTPLVEAELPPYRGVEVPPMAVGPVLGLAEPPPVRLGPRTTYPAAEMAVVQLPSPADDARPHLLQVVTVNGLTCAVSSAIRPRRL